MTAEEICDTSTKLVTFLDLAGHKKYIRTTIQGLSGYLPHHAMLVVGISPSFTEEGLRCSFVLTPYNLFPFCRYRVLPVLLG